GGRVFTDRRTFPDGQHCELGGEFIDTPHETMRDLAEELGIPLFDYATDDPRLVDDVADIGGRKLGEAELLAGFAPIARAVDAAVATLSDQTDPFVYYNKPNGGQALDALSISAWLDRIGAAGPVRTLLEVAYTTEFGLDPGESNALNLVFLIGTDLEQFRLYGESDERFHARRGNDAFTTRLAEALRPGQIRLGHTLEAIRPGPGAPYVLTFVRDARRVDVPADHVVLALPFTTLRRVDVGVALPPAKRRAIDELGYGTNTKLMGGLRSRVWRAQGFTGATFSDRGYQSSWDSSRLQPGSSGIITNFTGGSVGVRAGEGTPVQQLARFLDQFDGVFPGVAAASTGRAVRMHWTSYPLTLGSYAAYKVGQYTTIAGAEIERVGNLHFCGEHTSLDFQGYMEGGAATGAVAACELADDLGLEAADRPRLIRSPLGARILRRARITRAARRWHTALARSLQTT
ncbi:MAG: FAD-dependent oxidoreductase, partial [Chloroflexota bacterium]|nr:FAD-dependent oxidoreductase [Chloroflexota bacterium]